MKNLLKNNRWWLLGAAWMYTLTFVFDHYWSQSSSYRNIAENFSKRIEKRLYDFDAFCQDTASIKQLMAFELDSTELLQNNKDKDTYYYLFTDSPNGMQLQFWSNASYAPQPDDVPYRDTVKTFRGRNGIYVMASRRIPHSLITAVQLILIKQNYYEMQNTRLKQDYAGHPDYEEHIVLSFTPTKYEVKGKNNQPLFWLQSTKKGQPNIFNWASLTVEILVIILLLIFLYRIGAGLVQQRKLTAGFSWFIGTSALLRVCISLLNFPLSINTLEIFTPTPHASLIVHSTGDLLLNLLLLVWYIYFIIRSRFAWLPVIEKSSSPAKKLIGVGSLLLLLPITFWLSLLTIQLVMLPNISLNISSLLTLGWTLCAIACLYFICTIHYRLLSLANELYNHLLPKFSYLKFLLLAIGGLLFLGRLIHQPETTTLVLVLLWLLISLLVEDKIPTLFFSGVEQSVRFVFWLIWYAFAVSLMIQNQQQKKEQQSEIALARNLVRHTDNQALVEIKHILKGNELNALRKDPSLMMEDSAYGQYLRNVILDSFSNRLGDFKPSFYLFDSTGKTMYSNDTSISYEQLNTIIDQSLMMEDNQIYLYETTYEKFSYIIRNDLQQDSVKVGSFFITLSPTIFNTQALTLELFRPLRADAIAPQQIEYAIYDDRNLFYSNGDFPFATEVKKSDLPKQEYETKIMHGKKVLWLNAPQKRTVLVVNGIDFFNRIISLFAYIFGGFILLYLFELVLVKILTGGSWQRHKTWLLQPLSIRSKIRRTIIIISVGSFLLIGIVTVYFFIYRYESANKARLKELIAEANSSIQTLADPSLFVEKPDGQVATVDNSSTLGLIAALLNTDINLFDLSGTLTATSQPLAYDRGVVSTKMNPEAYYQMSVQKQVQYLQQENIGDLEYQAIYVPLRSEKGATLGYINIPSFASQLDLNQEISNFLVTLINIIAFISIIAGIVSFFITNSITSSFYIIGQKMKAINLGEINEPIEWNRNDEIGILVEQYNRMLKQLEESARKLASNEREYAWREMAKQVAHEIKNPLTPMKLNLQYLERQLQYNAGNVGELAKKMTGTLVAQIDHLSQIASDFSQLARINVTHNEIFDLHQVLQQLVALYQMDHSIELSWARCAEPLIIEADRTQINRLFTNLLKNASEAVSNDEETAIIKIKETISSDPSRITVAITDYGSGIPEERLEKIFTPNFTTKTSGTGLGLAICKGIVESAGGSIWVESRTGGPTTFFVQLPLLSDVID